jgi:ferredoxin
MQYYLTNASTNKKTGPIPVSTISKLTCPSACPLKGANGCYAENYPLKGHWDKVTTGERGTDFEGFIQKVRRLPNGIWRHAQAGDLPGADNEIDDRQLQTLAAANQNRPVIAYTHKPMTPENLKSLQTAQKAGFHVNLSANKLSEIDQLAETGLSVVTVLPSVYGRMTKGKAYTETLADYKERLRDLESVTPSGIRIAVCPATYLDDVTCQSCGACAKIRPANTAIGFPAHGIRYKRIDEGVNLGATKRRHNDKETLP